VADADILVTRVTDDGGLVWSQVIGADGREDAVAVLATPDGGCVIAGNMSPGIDQESNIFIMKLDADGQADLWPWASSP
jgi:hypothetical protein